MKHIKLFEGFNAIGSYIKDNICTDEKIIAKAKEFRENLKREGYTVNNDFMVYYPEFSDSGEAVGVNVGSDNHFITVLKNEKMELNRLVKYSSEMIVSFLKDKRLEGQIIEL